MKMYVAAGFALATLLTACAPTVDVTGVDPGTFKAQYEGASVASESGPVNIICSDAFRLTWDECEVELLIQLVPAEYADDSGVHGLVFVVSHDLASKVGVHPVNPIGETGGVMAVWYAPDNVYEFEGGSLSLASVNPWTGSFDIHTTVDGQEIRATGVFNQVEWAR